MGYGTTTELKSVGLVLTNTEIEERDSKMTLMVRAWVNWRMVVVRKPSKLMGVGCVRSCDRAEFGIIFKYFPGFSYMPSVSSL